ncbi:MAG TPA: NrfD/PsrC family molybdoenzyme membrane anchor subunit [Thermoanaerobaculia bacterium]|nr:NrfD/PsrC family molybdoenzyme membrane anchor subunit [Thermoanaerobaculia bacterium]
MSVASHTTPVARSPLGKPDFIDPRETPQSVSETISGVVYGKTYRWWVLALAGSFGLLTIGFLGLTWLLVQGVGVWGINMPVAWGWAIINFVWWIGIGHAGTLISAILLLLRQEWRTSINRFAEAMTLFAVACAGLFPIFHTGRPWLAYWMFPYPNTMRIWPQFRSPLIWDVFAVSTYAIISLVFWYVGLIPDLATMRDRAKRLSLRRVYGLFALGWRGAADHWHNYEKAYLLLAGLSTPLVLSVHSVVSFDFAVAQVPGWHATIFPPYFVAGAIYAGFAMVLTLMIPLRHLFGLHTFITQRHLENMGKVMLTTGLIVAYGYACELFMAYYSGNVFERFMMENRISGPYWYMYGMLILCNVAVPQLLWFKRFRASALWLFFVSQFVNVGMWLERFVIVVVSLHRDFLVSSWGMYRATKWDWAVYLGTIGLFLSLIFLFIRILPALSMTELKMISPEGKSVGEH